jgi:hypothetical protein
MGDLPYYLNGVPLPGVPSSPCDCTSTIQSATYTDPQILSAVRPDDNVLEIRGLNATAPVYGAWAQVTFSFDGQPDLVVDAIDPYDMAPSVDICASEEYGYFSGPRFSVPVEQCDGSSTCSYCQLPTLPFDCSHILADDRTSPDGLYRIDRTANTAEDAVTVYCDMTGGGVTYEELGVGRASGVYADFEVATATDLAEPSIQQALLWLYNMQGGMKNLEPGWVSSSCYFLAGTGALLYFGGSPLIPADLDDTGGQYHCNEYDETSTNIGGYSDPLMKFYLASPANTVTEPVPLGFFADYPVTTAAYYYDYGNPSFFFKRY